MKYCYYVKTNLQDGYITTDVWDTVAVVAQVIEAKENRFQNAQEVLRVEKLNWEDCQGRRETMDKHPFSFSKHHKPTV